MVFIVNLVYSLLEFRVHSNSKNWDGAVDDCNLNGFHVGVWIFLIWSTVALLFAIFEVYLVNNNNDGAVPETTPLVVTGGGEDTAE